MLGVELVLQVSQLARRSGCQSITLRTYIKVEVCPHADGFDAVYPLCCSLDIHCIFGCFGIRCVAIDDREQDCHLGATFGNTRKWADATVTRADAVEHEWYGRLATLLTGCENQFRDVLMVVVKNMSCAKGSEQVVMLGGRCCH